LSPTGAEIGQHLGIAAGASPRRNLLPVFQTAAATKRSRIRFNGTPECIRERHGGTSGTGQHTGARLHAMPLATEGLLCSQSDYPADWNQALQVWLVFSSTLDPLNLSIFVALV
jgi:hypothetical protein